MKAISQEEKSRNSILNSGSEHIGSGGGRDERRECEVIEEISFQPFQLKMGWKSAN